MKNRKKILLRAAYDILVKCHDSPALIDPIYETAFYDGTNCNGGCLIEDIAEELNIQERN